MLVSLSLCHFVLIDSSTIPFEKGLNILTGETGAGKTLLIQAIHLLLGQKVSTDSIRQGEEKATIEAVFDVENFPGFASLLEAKGIDFDPSEYLIIKREISRTSKNRTFVNGQMVPLSFLTEMAPFLFEVVGQNSSQLLRQTETQRRFLDAFANLTEEVSAFKASYEEEKMLEKQLRDLQGDASERERELERLKWQQEAWEKFGFVEGEGEALFDEYKNLSQSEEMGEQLLTLEQGLSTPLLPTLTQYRKLIEKYESLAPLSAHLESAILSLQEASFELSQALSALEQNPKRLQEIEERLSELNTLKKKYRLEESEIPEHLHKLASKLDYYEKIEDEIIEVKAKLSEKKEKNISWAQKLSKKRAAVIPELEKALKSELQELNLPAVEVQVQLNPKPLSSNGIDEVSFLFAPNKGEPLTSLKEKSSGGEIARFLLALKLIQARKEKIPTLIFDEIDSNVGGETASLVAEKLKTLGKLHQVLCITHFPQVARYADHHLQIIKNEKNGRTFTQVSPLTEAERKGELLRMLGGALPIDAHSR